jgi:ribonuclease-3
VLRRILGLGRKQWPQGRREALRNIRHRLGWRIRDEELYLMALRHRSAAPSHLESFERLELLGDAVLGLIVCEHLYKTRPSEDEGKLTEIKSLIVSKKILAGVARELGIGELLELSSDEHATGGRNKESILGDAMESLLAAYYLDAGLDAVRHFLQQSFLWRIEYLITDSAHLNFKGMLQEYLQINNDRRSARYSMKAESGPRHQRLFEVELKLDRKRYGMAAGHSKKEAEQMAAREALEKLREEAAAEKPKEKPKKSRRRR